MPRKQPFSTKQKKAQIQEKRERKRETGSRWAEDYVPRRGGNRAAGDIEANLADVVAENKSGLSSASLNPQTDRRRYKLQLASESPIEIERRKKESRKPLRRLPLREGLEVGLDQFFRPGSALDMPKRPPWKFTDSKEQVLQNEEIAFKAYVARLHAEFKFNNEELSYFELNLETWRQLWRVLEISDIICLVMDVRFAALHFPPPLFDHVKSQGKRVFLILNKCDLVGEPTTTAWREYFEERFPGIEVFSFSSFRTAKVGNPAARKKFSKQLAVPLGLSRMVTRWEELGLPGAAGWRHKLATRGLEGEVLETDVGEGVAEDSGSDEEESGGEEAGEEEEELEGEGDDEEEEAERNTTAAAVAGGSAARGNGKAAAAGGTGDSWALNVPEHPLDEAGTDHAAKKKFVTIGMVGQPNVGKSTIINSLVGKIVVSTSVTPGHTKHFQTYFLTDEIRLCDCPGLIFPSLVPRPLQILSGLYPVSQLREPYTAIGYLAQRVDLVALLRLKPSEDNEPWSAWNICEAWAEERSYYTTRAGRPDVYRAANDILRHCVAGRIVLSFKPIGFFDKYGEDAANHGEAVEGLEDAALAKRVAEAKAARYVVLGAAQAPPELPAHMQRDLDEVSKALGKKTTGRGEEDDDEEEEENDRGQGLSNPFAALVDEELGDK